MAGCHARAQYVPRCTQDSDALALAREHWPAFRDRLEEHAGALPAFVRDELEALLTCGDFEHGFLVAQCQRCGDSLHRLPAVPWRQWVLSFPGPFAVRLGYDRALLGSVCQRFATGVMQTLRRLTKRAHGLTSSAALHPGVLVVVQRFRNDLELFVHLHALVTDGCFDASDPDEPRFRPIAGLTDEHLVDTMQRMHADFAALEDDRDDDGDHEVDTVLAVCVQLALPLRAAAPSPREPPPALPLLVTAFGMQLHAAFTVDGRDRCRLEWLCRHLLRPPFAQDAVQRTADGRVRVYFKKPTRTGATYAQMTPHTFLARLCALVPPPPRCPHRAVLRCPRRSSRSARSHHPTARGARDAAPLTSTSVNHQVAQARAVTGNSAWHGRTLLEAVANQCGAAFPLPNVHLTTGTAFTERGADSTLPAWAHGEQVADPALWPLALDGSRGTSHPVDSDVLATAQALRNDVLDVDSQFNQAFAGADNVRTWTGLRGSSQSAIEQAELIDKLLFVPDAAPYNSGARGLSPSPDAELVRAAFPNYDWDPLHAQAALAFLLIKNRVSVTVTLGNSFDLVPEDGASLGGGSLPEGSMANPPIGFDFSHQAHRSTQAFMWSRLYEIAGGPFLAGSIRRRV